MELKPHHIHIQILLFIKILLIIALIILIKPALLGYKISQEFEQTGTTATNLITDHELLKTQLKITENNLQICNNLQKNQLDQLSSEKNTTFRCLQEKNELASKSGESKSNFDLEFSKLQSDFFATQRDLQGKLTTEELALSQLEEDYEQLIKNSARIICCKAKVDNSDIDSYTLSNNKIVCTIGENNKLNC